MDLAHDWRMTLVIVLGGIACVLWQATDHPYGMSVLAFATGFNVRTLFDELSDAVDRKAWALRRQMEDENSWRSRRR